MAMWPTPMRRRREKKLLPGWVFAEVAVDMRSVDVIDPPARMQLSGRYGHCAAFVLALCFSSLMTADSAMRGSLCK